MKRKPQYKHKLNMLEPGGVMVKIIALFVLLGAIFRAVKLQVLSAVALGTAGLIFAVLLILIAVELHQDRVLNEAAEKEPTDE